MFSPYYYWAGRRDPGDHVCVNVALYGDGWQRWAMTERGRAALTQAPTRLNIAASALEWSGEGLTVHIAERSVPHLAPLRGAIRLRPQAEMRQTYALDAARRHWWRPIAPAADIELNFDRPGLHWRGAGYFDMNWGAEPLEAGFTRWDWSRAPVEAGAAVLYDAERRDGSRLSLGLRFDGKGGVEDVAPPPRAPLPATLYRLKRFVQTDDGASVRVLRRLEDAPFYARSELRTRLFGREVHAMHESLDCDRFAAPWVKAMLPWRMPRLRR